MEEFDLLAADELIAARIDGGNFACESGCDWCCRQLIVMTNKADGRAMLAAARANRSARDYRELKRGLREQAEAIAALTHEQAEVRQWPCPFLADGKCSIYSQRPVACRSVFSSDASCCRAMLEADSYDDLSAEHQEEATKIGERAMGLQLEINDQRPVDGGFEMRALLVHLLEVELARN